ncbi:VrrA/YqfQ family protein [Niallia nealsonii]|uniref:YqfQ-like protein n=1 Tax=Niallia nealsonii TaxID=115979 RepID=A0A2N0YXE6_9BACI|nr:VrrA/YqfQ family protein [Niallia nealsonii]PKG21935.1 hypothetical protein CWS01_19890 [Niallia nealsonii]
MPPRQQMPFQRGMGGRMMPPQGSANFRGGPRGPGLGRGAGGAGARNGGSSGGILSKLLGGGNKGAANAATGTASAGARSAGAGGGLLKTITNPASINGFLANSQKFLNTASQLGPMINQYGPMVRNIPAMWKLYRGLKNTGSANENTTTTETNTPINEKAIENKPIKQHSNKTKPAPKDVEINIQEEEELETKSLKRNNGSSIPKLYV